MNLSRQPPRGLLRLFLRMPVWLYRLGLGRLLGERFLRLEHTGRKTGLPRQTVVEVIGRNPAAGTYTVMAAWGARSDWFRNVQCRPDVTIQTGGRTLPMRAETLPPGAAAAAVQGYARRHPGAYRQLSTALIGGLVEPTAANLEALVQFMPVVRFRPRQARATGPASARIVWQ